MSAASDLLGIVKDDRDAVLKAIEERNAEAYAAVRKRVVAFEPFIAAYDEILAKSQLTGNNLLFQRLEAVKTARADLLNNSLIYLKPYDVECAPRRPSVAVSVEIVDRALAMAGQAMHDFEKLVDIADRRIGQENWPSLAYVARGLRLKQSSDVFKLLEKGELKDNGLEGRDRLVDPMSILEYCLRSGAAWGSDDAHDESPPTGLFCSKCGSETFVVRSFPNHSEPEKKRK